MDQLVIYHYGKHGELLAAGHADPDPLTPGQWLIPAQACIVPPLPASAVPEDHEQRFDTVSQAWSMVAIPTVPPSVPTRAQQIAAIEQRRDVALSNGLTYQGRLYHADSTFQSQLQAFILAYSVGILAPTATVAIRRKDNVTVQMTQTEVLALSAAMMQFVQDAYAASWAEKDAL
jgi:hypothetical protein